MTPPQSYLHSVSSCSVVSYSDEEVDERKDEQLGQESEGVDPDFLKFEFFLLYLYTQCSLLLSAIKG